MGRRRQLWAMRDSGKMHRMPATATPIRTARRVDRFSYAIRNIVIEAQKVERAGRKVRYLNIGDPNQFGFVTPPHLVEAVVKAMRDGHNGYVPSPGIPAAREAAAGGGEDRPGAAARAGEGGGGAAEARGAGA